MENDPLQKTVLITGGATGLGKSIALKLKAASFNVAVTDIGKYNENFPAFLCDLTFSLNSDFTNWLIANHQGIRSLLENCGFEVIANPDDETYIAQINPQKTSFSTGWNASEYLSAVGKAWKEEVGKKTGKERGT